MTRPPRRRDEEAGSATLSAALLCAGLMIALMAILGGMSIIISTHTARGIADRAALAGAGQALGGAERACAEAAALAETNGGEVTSCTQHLLDVTVQIRVRAALVGAVTATARAGPATTPLPEN